MAACTSAHSCWSRASSVGEVVHRLVEVQELELGARRARAGAGLRRRRRRAPSAGRARRGCCSAVVSAWNTDRGNSRSSRRNSTAVSRVDRVLVGAQVRLVRRAAAQRRGPPGATERVAVAGAQQPRASCRRARGCDRRRRTASRRRGSSSRRRCRCTRPHGRAPSRRTRDAPGRSPARARLPTSR